MLLRRLFLIIPIASILWWALYEPSRELWYMVPVALISSFILFYNIPLLVQVLHLKPFYYEDLEDLEIDTDDDEINTRYKFQKYFTISITISLSIAFCIVLDYVMYNFKKSDLKWFEQIGIIGGAMSLYGNIQDKLGKILLMYFMKTKKKQQRKRSLSRNKIIINTTHSDECKEVELQEITDT